MFRRSLTTIGALLCAAILLAACGGDSFDRDEAVQDLVDGGVDQATAECVVDAIVDEFGEDVLNENREPTDEESARLFELLSECALSPGGDDAAAAPATTAAPAETAAPTSQAPAETAAPTTEAPAETAAPTTTPAAASPSDLDDQDAVLAALFDACADGEASSCDILYFNTPVDSEEEAFGASCGGTVDPPTPGQCTGSAERPSNYGDNSIFDTLHDACADGDLNGCDLLYVFTPPTSDYETFAATCGGRRDAQPGSPCA